MIFQFRKLLFLCSFFFFIHTVYAQEDLDYCELPATEDITFISIGTDHLYFYWTPVEEAVSYDVLVIDLNTNIILHENTDAITEIFISGINVTDDVFVSISANCSNGVSGQAAIVNVKIGSFIFEDLVLQLNMPEGPDINLYCGEIIENKSAPTWASLGGLGTIDFNLNTSSLIFSEIEGDDNIGDLAYSMMLLGTNKNSGIAYSKFPISNSVNNQSVNTHDVKSPSLPHPADATIYDDKFMKPFYSISVAQSAAIIADLDFVNSYNNGVTMQTRYCLEGVRKPLQMEWYEEEHVAAIQSSAYSSSADFIDDARNKSSISSNQDFSLSPNPASDKLTIKFPSTGMIEILDMNGRVWLKKQVSNLQEEIVVASFPAGTYVIRYDGKDAPIIERFVKL